MGRITYQARPLASAIETQVSVLWTVYVVHFPDKQMLLPADGSLVQFMSRPLTETS